MPRQERGGRRDHPRKRQKEDAAFDQRHRQVKTPEKGGQHPPGMGEDEDESYVPEKERP
jgi:hypothetical protein